MRMKTWLNQVFLSGDECCEVVEGGGYGAAASEDRIGAYRRVGQGGHRFQVFLRICRRHDLGSHFEWGSVDRLRPPRDITTAAADERGRQIGEVDDPIAPGADGGEPTGGRSVEHVKSLKARIVGAGRWANPGHHDGDVGSLSQCADDAVGLLAGIDQCQWAGCRQAVGEKVIDGVVLGNGSVLAVLLRAPPAVLPLRRNRVWTGPAFRARHLRGARPRQRGAVASR